MRTNSARAGLAGVLGIAVLASGCYLGHLAVGQVRLLCGRRPIAELLADAATPAELRARLALVRDARDFAADLGLKVGEQYTSFAAWPGDRVVTTLVATRPGEVEPAGFWFPITGRVPYKGFFDAERAAAEAARLRERGLDVCESAVRAYSTLGWFADPVTGPMLQDEPGALVETLIHELVHATLYVADRARVNEGVATFVGSEGSVRFYAEAGDPAAAARRRRAVADARLLGAELERLRGEVEALYAEAAEPAAGPRAELEAGARRRIAALPLATRDADALAPRLALNDACLALAGTYSADLPRYDARLAALGGDLRRFVAILREAAHAEDPFAALLGEDAAAGS